MLSSEKSDGSTKEKACQEFAAYAWADEKKSVKIYIDFEGADQVDDNDISVHNTKTSLEFAVSLPGNSLCFLKLHTISFVISISYHL